MEKDIDNVTTYSDVRVEILKCAEELGGVSQKLPAEREFCNLLHVSRSTVRKALQALETEGLVQRSRGSGWYLSAPPLKFDPCNHIPYSYLAIKQGRQPSWEVTNIEEVIPSSGIVKSFNIHSNRLVFKIEVLLKLDLADRCNSIINARRLTAFSNNMSRELTGRNCSKNRRTICLRNLTGQPQSSAQSLC